ncbi:MAG TPA: NAD(+)/NADH kinase [Candidatus Scatomorpha stercoravium]|nr:NAD(+)/NADH kinase [Candidatus Scatomorpha stercoravium]
MKKIVLAPNPYRDRGLALTLAARTMLESDGHSTVISPAFVDVPADSPMQPLGRAAAGADLIITFGGDGTMLHVARQVLTLGVPMLGVNVGTKGFMAAIEPEELALVRRAAAGEYRESPRMMLSISVVREGADVLSDHALNDAVVKSDVNCVDLTVASDGQDIARFSGDGVICATPTGSTAYSMSAGGPIIEPEAQNIVVTPICAHSMSARSFVLSPERRISISSRHRDNRRVFLSVDGSAAFELLPGDEVRVRRSSNTLMLAEMGRESFYNAALGKLAAP